MSVPKLVDPALLYHRCDPQELAFETTAELSDLTDVPGQRRATEGLRVLIEWTGASDIVVLAGGAERPLWQPALEALLRGAYSYERAAPGSVAVALIVVK